MQKGSSHARVLDNCWCNGVGIFYVSRHTGDSQEITERGCEMLLQYIVAFMIIGLIGIIVSLVRRK